MSNELHLHHNSHSHNLPHSYIASSPEVVSYIRATAPASLHANNMSAATAAQALASLSLINNDDGSGRGLEKIRTLR